MGRSRDAGSLCQEFGNVNVQKNGEEVMQQVMCVCRAPSACFIEDALQYQLNVTSESSLLTLLMSAKSL